MELEKITNALDFLDASVPRDEWWPIAAALKSELGDAGFEIFSEWSSTASSYNRADCWDTWKSLRSGGITILTLYKRASDAGWRWKDDGTYSPPPPRKKTPPLPPKLSPTFQYAQEIWGRYGVPCYMENAWVQTHPYSLGKRITRDSCAARTGPPPPDGAKVQGRLVGYRRDCLIIPMFDTSESLVGVECINEEGVKQTFGQKGFLILGDSSAEAYIFVEGWATGVVLLNELRRNRDADDIPAIVVCFAKSRIIKLKEHFYGAFPEKLLINGVET